MRRALAALAVKPRYVLIDGNDLPAALCCDGETIVDGDTKSMSIAAASIVAKVTRDRLMCRLCRVYPVYGFSRHVGYSTEEHLAAIARHGPCPYHRLSFSPFRPEAAEYRNLFLINPFRKGTSRPRLLTRDLYRNSANWRGSSRIRWCLCVSHVPGLPSRSLSPRSRVMSLRGRGSRPCLRQSARCPSIRS